MRTTADRIRHAVSFEIIGILLATPLAAFAFHLDGGDSTVVVAASATVAMLWNYVYNLLFDKGMQHFRGTTEKTKIIRVFHAVFFEVGLLAIMLPMIAWYLNISLLQAFLMDLGLAIFYMVYALVFNWVYDRVFPLPEWQAGEKA